MKNIVTEEKPVMSLYNYHKRRLTFWAVIFVEQIYNNMIDFLHLYENNWSTVVLTVMLIPLVISLFRYIYPFVGYRLENDDELSKDNMNKAHASMSGIFILFIALLYFVTSFWDGSVTVTITSRTVTAVAFPMLCAYYILESGLFMLYEGKTPDEAEEE
jgi:hypothetical protein